EAEPARFEIRRMALDRYPLSALAFTRFAGRVAARKRVKQEIARLREEPNKERRKLDRESRGVRLYVVELTEFEIPPVRIVVAVHQEVGRNRTSPVGKLSGYYVARRADLGTVAAFDQSAHIGAVFVQHPLVVGLRVGRFRQPPEAVDRVLHPYLPDRDPFCRRRELCGVVPVELLREVETDFTNERDQQVEMIKRARRPAGRPRAADVYDETAVVAQNAMDLAGKRQKPFDILALVGIPVFFLEV